jgi:EAL domain-containing protein (putative c-di-GMP-specific phosphodiesterase class I)
VIAMGKRQMRVVAEGVETREQLAFLREKSCPVGQGHFFSPPVPASEVVELLGGRRDTDRGCVTADIKK